MSAPGLSALYDALARCVARHDLDAFAFAVDDPDLGRQCFAAGPGARAALARLADDPDLRWWANPEREHPPDELDALRALAVTALRLARVEPAADPAAALETVVRGLPGVAEVLRLGTIVEAAVAPGAREECLARLTALDLPGVGALVLRDPTAADESEGEEAADAPGDGDGGRRARLVGVHTRPDTGELEIHLAAGERRTVGRGPLARAGQSAAAATLDALDALDPGAAPIAEWRVGWVRTIDTTMEREFLVAVMIRRGRERPLYGLAAGASPVEAAARATLHATNRILALLRHP